MIFNVLEKKGAISPFSDNKNLTYTNRIADAGTFLS